MPIIDLSKGREEESNKTTSYWLIEVNECSFHFSKTDNIKKLGHIGHKG